MRRPLQVEAATGKRLRTFKYTETVRSALDIFWNPDGSRISVACDEEFVEIREVSTGKIVKKLQDEVGLKIVNKTFRDAALLLLVEMTCSQILYHSDGESFGSVVVLCSVGGA